MSREVVRVDRAVARRMVGYLFGSTLAVYLATTGGSFATDLASYEVTKNLVEHGTVAMSYNVLDTDAERGIDGRYYAPVGIGHPVFGVPFYVAARLVERLTGLQAGKPESLRKAAVVLGSAVAAAGCVAVVFLLAWEISRRPRSASAVALALAFGTILWPYSKFGFNAPLAALCLAASVYWAWTGARLGLSGRPLWAGVALGAAVLTRHEMAVAAVPIALWLHMETRRGRRLWRTALSSFAAPVLVALGLWAWYNSARFGHPLDTGLLRDPNVRFDTPLLMGLHGLLLSPGRSLFLYSPLTVVGTVALVWLARRDRNTALLFGGVVLVLLPVYGTLHQWDGGQSYGPRYLVPVLPFLVTPLVFWLKEPNADARMPPRHEHDTSPPRLRAWRGVLDRAHRTWWPVLVACSVAVQLPGVLVDFSKVQQRYARTRADYSIDLARYTWDAAPLVLNTKTALEAVPRNLAYLTGRMSPPAIARTAEEGARDFSQQFSFGLDFWWLYLYYLGVVSAPVAVALGCAPLLVAMALGLALRRAGGAAQQL